VPTEDLAAAGRTLNSFAVHLLRALHRVDAESGLSPARLSALSVLHFAGPRSLGRLARDEEVSSPTMSRLVDALSDLGLVTRAPHPDSARMVVVSTTDAGGALMQEATARRGEVIATAVEALPRDAREAVLAAVPHLPRLERAAVDAVRTRSTPGS
jgi:DNA-binding MarR family transcriptional regulator